MTGTASAGWPEELRPRSHATVKSITERTTAYIETLGIRQNIYVRTMNRLAAHAQTQADIIGELHTVIERHKAMLPPAFIGEVLATVKKWMKETEWMGEAMQEAQESTEQEEVRLAAWLAKQGQ